jgi:hypothetical protein
MPGRRRRASCSTAGRSETAFFHRLPFSAIVSPVGWALARSSVREVSDE